MTQRLKCCFLPQFWLFPIYRELLNTASRNRPSKDSEVRRAASGLVKVLCTANDCSIGKKGSRKGKPLKQGGALAKFNEVWVYEPDEHPVRVVPGQLGPFCC